MQPRPHKPTNRDTAAPDAAAAVAAVPPGGRGLTLAALLALLLAALLLWIGADSTPTTPTSRRLFGLWQARWIVLALGLAVVAVGCWLAKRSKETLFGFVAIVASVGLVVGVLEAAGRLGLVSWSQVLSPAPGPASGLGTRAVPNLDVRGVTYQDTAMTWGLRDSPPMPFHYRTDRYGMRNQPDREKADVYLLGDSMLVSALVPHEATVPAQLEKRLGRPVMQVALIAISPQREHDLFRQVAPDVRGRRVVQFVFEGNDLGDSRAYRLASSSPAPAAADGPPLSQLLWHQLTRLTEPTVGIAPLHSCTIGDRRYTFFWTRNAFDGLDDEIPVVTGALERFAAEIRGQGGEYAVVFVPKKLRVLGEACRFREDSPLRDVRANLGPLRERLHAWSQASGIPLLDFTEPLQAATARGTVPWFESDTHWNAIGQEIAAEQLARWSFLR